MKNFLDRIVSRKDEGEVEIEDFLSNLQTKREDIYENADAFVMPVDLGKDEDAAKVVDEAKKGNVVLVNISTLHARNPIRLKALVAKIRDQIDGLDGDIARLSDELVLVTPARVKIVKRR